MSTIESVYVRTANTADEPDNVNWPKPVAAILAEYNTAVDAWDAARLKQADTLENLRNAAAKDDQALTDALAAGKSDPGTPNHDLYSRQYIVDTKALDIAARKVDALTDRFHAAVREHSADTIAAVIDTDQAALDHWRQAVKAAGDAADEANRIARTVGKATIWARWALRLNGVQDFHVEQLPNPYTGSEVSLAGYKAKAALGNLRASTAPAATVTKETN